MAIVVICPHCQGKGVVEKTYFKYFKTTVNCPKCKGTGKRKVSKKSKIH